MGELMLSLDELITEYLKDLSNLWAKGAVHNSALHETDAAKSDKGRMSFCAGCEAVVLSRRLAEAFNARDDRGQPPRTEENPERKSRHIRVAERLNERRDIE